MAVNSVNTYITATNTNEVAMPLQPCFLAWLDVSVLNVTGDGTEYTIILDTEEFDVNADFNLGTSTFTAPVTGKYKFCARYQMQFDIANPTSAVGRFKASNRTYRFVSSTSVVETQQGIKGYSAGIIIDMDATDTLTYSVEYGGGAKNMDVYRDYVGEYTSSLCGALLV